MNDVVLRDVDAAVDETSDRVTEGAFDWRNCWYPVSFLDDLPRDRPTPFSLYGVIGLWCVILTGVLAAARRRLRLAHPSHRSEADAPAPAPSAQLESIVEHGNRDRFRSRAVGQPAEIADAQRWG